MPERFVDEKIVPQGAPLDTRGMAVGEPGVPSRFRWGERIFEVGTVLRTWRQTGKCRHGSADIYVRRHWFEIVTTEGLTMKIYFDRQPRNGASGGRWWLFTVSRAE